MVVELTPSDCTNLCKQVVPYNIFHYMPLVDKKINILGVNHLSGLI